MAAQRAVVAAALAWLAVGATGCGDDEVVFDAASPGVVDAAAARPDAARPDAGAVDAGAVDAGAPDAAPPDAAGPDADPSEIVIDFDDLAEGVAVTDQYAAHATFSSTAGQQLYTLVAPMAIPSPPHFVCTGTAGVTNCTNDVFLDFTAPVSGLRFNALGANDSGTIAEVRVFESGVLSATEPVVTAAPAVVVPVDLSAHSNVTRIEIVNVTDAFGLGWDDFRFTP